MNCQMMRVISSPSSSTTVPVTLIFDMSCRLPLGGAIRLITVRQRFSGADGNSGAISPGGPYRQGSNVGRGGSGPAAIWLVLAASGGRKAMGSGGFEGD